jgi:hypothetical protein
MDVLIALFLIVGLVVLFDLAAIAFGAESREAFRDPRYRSTVSIR